MTCGGAFQAKRYIGSYFIEDLFGDRTLTRLLLGAPKTNKKTNGGTSGFANGNYLLMTLRNGISEVILSRTCVATAGYEVGWGSVLCRVWLPYFFVGLCPT